MASRYWLLSISGTRPLLVHAANSLGGTGGRTGTKPDPGEEAEAALHKDRDGNPIIPSINILAAMKKAAVDFKVPGKGRRTYLNYILSGLDLAPVEIPLLSASNGHIATWEVDLKPVVVQRARIHRARPRFDDWALDFDLTVLDPIIAPDTARTILESAGQYNGLCDFRPLYGLFQVDLFDRVE
ncbi:MAG: hypothetical protein ACE5Q6_04785 [Dehalococcoidia bacterium]